MWPTGGGDFSSSTGLDLQIYRDLQDLEGQIIRLKGELSPEVEKSAVMVLKVLTEHLHQVTSHRIRSGMVEMLTNVDARLQEFARTLQSRKTKQSLLPQQLEEAVRANHQALEMLSLRSSHKVSEAFERIWGSKANSDVVDGSVRQMPVFNQAADGTSFGLENCGYHALKNALLSIAPGSQTVHELFQDRQIFTEFYERYCRPEVEYSSGAKRGRMDASAPRLRAIINRIQNDPDPPERLSRLKLALHPQRNCGSLAIMYFRTADGTINGRPVLGISDEASAEEALKLYSFAKAKGPETLSIACGHEASGHWYTLTMNKDPEGTIRFVGCDSIENGHGMHGLFSPLAKMAGLLEELLESPEALLDGSLDAAMNVVERRAEWVNPKGGEPKTTYIELLLSEQPKEVYSSVQFPERSYSDWVIDHCVLAAKIGSLGNYFDSSDYERLLQMQQVNRLIGFYADNLTGSHPRFQTVRALARELPELMPSDIVTKALEQVYNRMDTIKGQEIQQGITEAILNRTRELFEAIERTHQTADKLARIYDDNEREAALQVDLGGGVEGGFLGTGDTEQQRLKAMEHTVNGLLCVFSAAQRAGRVLDLIRAIGTGSPCLSGRKERAQLFAAELAHINMTPEHASQERIDMLVSDKLAEALCSIVDDQTETDEEGFRLLQGMDGPNLVWTPEMLSVLSKWMRSCDGDTDQAVMFRSQLLAQGMVDSVDDIDWDAVTPAIVALPEFRRWFAQAKAIALDWLSPE